VPGLLACSVLERYVCREMKPIDVSLPYMALAIFHIVTIVTPSSRPWETGDQVHQDVYGLRGGSDRALKF
jgi:hypothetical protein